MAKRKNVNNEDTLLKMEPETIMVIGNGFDLHCELASSFSSFYENYASKHLNKCIWYQLLKMFYYQDTTINRLFPFIHKNDILWMDVEDLIKRIVCSTKEGIGGCYLSSYDCWHDYIDPIHDAYLNCNNISYLNDVEQFRLLKCFFRDRNVNYGSTKNDIIKFLFDELRTFEMDFANYIIRIISDDYKKSASLLLFKMLEEDEVFYLFNFNYTSFAIKDAISYCSYNYVNNVHGIASLQNCIIGYDDSDIDLPNEKSNAIMLTKIYQKTLYQDESEVLPSSIKYIKFYGHSLGSQDYSYFHSLFDIYDVYNSDITLIFYYSRHGKTEEEKDNNETQYSCPVICQPQNRTKNK